MMLKTSCFAIELHNNECPADTKKSVVTAHTFQKSIKKPICFNNSNLFTAQERELMSCNVMLLIIMFFQKLYRNIEKQDLVG